MKEFTTMDFLRFMAAAGIRIDVSPKERSLTPYDVRDKLVAAGVPEKVIWAHASTAAARGYWDSGVTSLAGWVTRKGLDKLAELGLLAE